MKPGAFAIAILWLFSYTSAQAGEKYEPTVLIHGEWGNKPGEFGQVEYLGDWMSKFSSFEFAVDDEGNIFIGDTGNNRVQKFNPAGHFSDEFPLEIFVAPSHAEYDQAESWNTRGDGFAKVVSKGLAWTQGKLFTKQIRMPDVRKKEFVEQVLVLQGKQFLAASQRDAVAYEAASTNAPVDSQGNKYLNERGIFKKHNAQGEILFQMGTYVQQGQGRRRWDRNSTVHFDPNGKALYEIRAFAHENKFPSEPHGGGIELLKWTLVSR